MRAYFVLGVLVEVVEINVGEKLAGVVADRQAGPV
jgi:hypothetical protein